MGRTKLPHDGDEEWKYGSRQPGERNGGSIRDLFPLPDAAGRDLSADVRRLFEYSGNRAIVFHVEDVVPTEPLSHCIALALRYHLDKK